MAKAILILEDLIDGSLGVNVEFDPPLNPLSVLDDFPGSVTTALYLIEVLNTQNISDEE